MAPTAGPTSSSTERATSKTGSNGKPLHTTGTVIDGGTLRYRASKFDCDSCCVQNEVLPPHACAAGFLVIFMKTPAMSPVALANTEAFEQSRRERKKVEMRFAHMKRILRLDRIATVRLERGQR